MIKRHRTLAISSMSGLLALVLLFGVALAAGETLSRGLVGSGGGQISGGGLRLHSAIGQPAVGTVGDGPTLCSGLLCGPGAPPSSAPEFFLFLPLVVR